MHGGYMDFSIQQWINFSADGDIAIASFPKFQKMESLYCLYYLESEDTVMHITNIII